MKVALSANAQGVREELIEALADALVADIEQFPVLPMPVPVLQEWAEADGAHTPARSGIMRPEPAGGVRRPPRRPGQTGGTR
jgi:hypothetical protein